MFLKTVGYSRLRYIRFIAFRGVGGWGRFQQIAFRVCKAWGLKLDGEANITEGKNTVLIRR